MKTRTALAAASAPLLILPLAMAATLMMSSGGNTTGAGSAPFAFGTQASAVCSTGGAGPDEGGVTAPANEIAVKVARKFAEAGYSKASAAGVLGNLEAESEFNPTLSTADGAYGIAQWTPGSKIRVWFDAHGLAGVPISDVDGQIRMLVETASDDFNDHYYDTVTNIAKKGTLLETWRTAPDARIAAIAWMAGWERPDWGLRHEERRVAVAQAFHASAELSAIDWKVPDGSSLASPSDPSAGTGGTAAPAGCTLPGTPTTATGQLKGMIERAKAMAADDSIGYSQARRRLDPDADCSSFVYYAMVQGGGWHIADDKSPFTTSGMPSYLPSLGFTQLPKLPYQELQEGDILLNPGEHTEIFTGVSADGSPHSIGAHSDRGHPQGGDQTGTEVSEGFLWVGYTEVWRYSGPAAPAGA